MQEHTLTKVLRTQSHGFSLRRILVTSLTLRTYVIEEPVTAVRKKETRPAFSLERHQRAHTVHQLRCRRQTLLVDYPIFFCVDANPDADPPLSLQKKKREQKEETPVKRQPPLLPEMVVSFPRYPEEECVYIVSDEKVVI